MKESIKKIVGKHYVSISKQEYINRIFAVFDSSVIEDTEVEHMYTYGKSEIYKLWRTNPDLYYNLEFDSLLKVFRIRFPEESKNHDVVNIILKKIEDMIARDKQIYIYNVELFNIKKLNEAIVIGDFSLLNKEEFIKTVSSLEGKEWWKRLDENQVFWRCSLEVSEKYRGLELIEEYIRLFTNAIRVLNIEQFPRVRINFLNHSPPSRKNIIFNTKEQPTGPTKRDYIYSIVDITQTKLDEFHEIWNHLFRIRANKNEIFERIELAITWLGESMEESRTEQALVKATFALESLVGRNKNSISDNLATYTAFILGVDFEARKQIKARVKYLYHIRSRVVHGKEEVCFEYQYLEMCDYAKSIINKFIKDPRFRSFTTFKEIEEYVENALLS